MKAFKRLLPLAILLGLASSSLADHRIVIDEADSVGVTITGAWTTASSDSERFGEGYLHDQNAGKGTKSVKFTPTITVKGKYKVYGWWPADVTFDDVVEVTVESADSPDNLTIDQTATGGQWVLLGEYTFNPGTEGNVTISNANTSATVIADAVMFVLQDEIVDNDHPTKVDVIGSWTSATATAGFWGADYFHDNNTGKGSKTFWFLPEPLWPGQYDLYLRWTSDIDRDTDVPVEVESLEGTDPLLVDQQNDGGEWVLLGSYGFDWTHPIAIGIGNAGTTGYVVADAIKLSISGFVVDNADIGFSSTGTWTTATSPTGFEGANFLHDGDTAKGTKTAVFEADIPEEAWYTVFLKWTSGSDRADKVPVTVTHAGGNAQRYVNQKENGGEWVSVGTWVFDTTATVTIETDSTSGYVIADSIKLNRVTDGDFDEIFDAWEAAHGLDFTDPADAAEDPDEDGLTNLEEFEEGSDPEDYYNGEAPVLSIVSGDRQSGTLDQFLPAPLIVRVLDGENQPLVNAPVEFNVTASSGKLSKATSGQPEVTSLTLRTNINGYIYSGLEAVYVKLPDSFEVVEVTATAGGQSVVFEMDSDQDGMPDGFEVAAGLDAFGDDAMLDLDADRYPNIFEYANGTDPDDDGSVPVADVEVDPLGVVTTIQAGLNLVTEDYQIVSVAPGVYNESIVVADYKTLVRSEGGPLETTIALSGEGTVVGMFASGALDGFTVRHTTGAGLGVLLADGVSSRISHSVVERNHSNGVWAGLGTKLIVENVILRENTPFVGTLVSFGAQVRIFNSTFLSNRGLIGGHAFWLENSGTIEVKNSIIWDVDEDEVLGDGLTIENSIIRGGFTGSGNLDQDPLLTRHGFIKTGSPAISMAVADASLTDIRNVARDVTPDSGADEFKDTDLDGLPDWWETAHGLDPNTPGASADSDTDNLENLDEYLNGTDPTEADSDGDGIEDNDELLAGSDPLRVDTDSDGMPDGYENSHGLNLLVDDTLEDKDGDRVPNYFEFIRETDPADAGDKPVADVVVDPVGTFTTIAAGLAEVTEDYRIVEVLPGTYAETVDVAEYRTLLISRDGASATTIEVSTDAFCVRLFSSGAVDGFTLTHDANVEGSAVLVGDDQVIRIANCIVSRHLGNAIYANPRASVRVENCFFQENRPFAGTLVAYQAKMVVSSSSFAHNTASLAGHALWVHEGTVNFRNCILWDVSADEILGEGVTIEDSIVRGGFTGSGNTDSDPLLNRHGYLTASSPALGLAGTGASLRDIRGALRDVDPDSGAEEFVDTDSDGAPDWWETEHSFNPAVADSSNDPDTDGLDNLGEFLHGTDPALSDTDDDGLEDNDEILAGTDPLDSDSDDDEMPDGYEAVNTLDPLSNDRLLDKDGDRIPNIYEYFRSTDPTDENSKPVADVSVDPGGVITTIQAGLDEVTSDYEIVAVAPGLYAENLELAEYRTLLISEEGADSVVVQPGDDGPGLSLLSSGVVDGFTFRHAITTSGPAITIANDLAARIARCILEDNPRSGVIAHGGAKLLVENTLFRRNAAASGTVVSHGAEIEITSCTFWQNEAWQSGNAVSVEEGGAVVIRNSILWDASAEEIAGDNVTIEDSIVRGGFTGSGNTDIDPELTRLGYLTTGSPAVGSAGATPVLWDIRGAARDIAPDAGSDEFIDSDSDSAPDWWEDAHTLDPGTSDSSADLDSDGLTNLEEYINGTDPNEDDSDGDGLLDGGEVNNGFDPLNGDENNNGEEDGLDDFDGDGISNSQELIDLTDPFDAGSATSPPATEADTTGMNELEVYTPLQTL